MIRNYRTTQSLCLNKHFCKAIRPHTLATSHTGDITISTCLMPQGKRIEDDKRKMVHRMFAEGTCGKAIAGELGISKTSVYQILCEGQGKQAARRGRKKTISARMRRRILAEVRKKPRAGLRKIASALKMLCQRAVFAG